MPLISRNPYSGEVLGEFPEMSPGEVRERLLLADRTFAAWSTTPLSNRAALIRRLGGLMAERAPELGRLAALEMGKPIAQAVSEVKKCALACDYYADNAVRMLQPEAVETDAGESLVRFDPIGAVLAVMPWNFPFWQVMRFAAPALMAGNVGLLKHASSVPQCAAALERAFLDAGFPAGAFQNLPIGSAQVEAVVRHPAVRGVALTGSEQAGRAVAAVAGSEIKKTVLELGGSDPFIVLADADLPEAARMAALARLQNNGQSCIAAKRFIAVRSAHDEFLELFRREMEAAVAGDPLDERTTLGPLVNEAAVREIERQVAESVAMGAKIAVGGRRLPGSDLLYAATVLSGVRPGMPAYREETFGPVAAVIMAEDAEDAVRIANDTAFGLGASVWTRDAESAKGLAGRIRAGSVFVNGMVKSDPRLPFGGTGLSGYGRELADYGLKEFVNVKTVWIK